MVALLLPAVAAAEGEGFNLNYMRIAPGGRAHFVTHTADTMSANSAGFDFFANLGYEPLVSITSDDRRTVLVDRALFFTAAGRIGLSAPVPMELQLILPVGLALEGINPRTGGPLAPAAAGDVTLGLKILGMRRGKGGLVVYPWLSLPSGDPENLAGEQSASFGLLGGYEHVMGPVRLAGNLSFMRRGEVDMGKTQVGDLIGYSVGLQYDTMDNDLFFVGGELFGAVDTADFGNTDHMPFEADVGASLKVGGACRVGTGLGFGIIRGIGAGTYRFLGTLSCSGGGECPETDSDGDGITKCSDQCPDDPEDKDGVADWDGCPEDDYDNDGIPDADDLCPLQPEDKDGYNDEDGCPEAGEDRDQDGVPDATDKCPDEKEDRDGFQDDDGCPDPDNDKDGFEDSEDKCPNEAEDKDGFQDDDGCPDDNDDDGIPDAIDKCPNEPETYNDVEDSDGCPDGEELVVKRGGRLEIHDVIHFKTNSAEISRKSRRLLYTIATVLRKHKEIKKVRIEGHTDDKASEKYNQRLSEARAKSVRRYLIRLGISPDRLEAKGYGESRPLIDLENLDEFIEQEIDKKFEKKLKKAIEKRHLEGKALEAYEKKLERKKEKALAKAKTKLRARYVAKARARNRRVEFIIVEQ